MILEEKELLNQDSKALAVIIIVNRVLGSYREEAKICMMILMQRKMSGEIFEFEKFIKDGVKEYQIKVDTNLLKGLKKQISNSLTNNMIKSI